MGRVAEGQQDMQEILSKGCYAKRGIRIFVDSEHNAICSSVQGIKVSGI